MDPSKGLRLAPTLQRGHEVATLCVELWAAKKIVSAKQDARASVSRTHAGAWVRAKRPAFERLAF
ncbi:MAG: hypothetical protein U0350_24810 [Caldilineaceae bacterium]